MRRRRARAGGMVEDGDDVEATLARGRRGGADARARTRDGRGADEGGGELGLDERRFRARGEGEEE